MTIEDRLWTLENQMVGTLRTHDATRDYLVMLEKQIEELKAEVLRLENLRAQAALKRFNQLKPLEKK